jgi:hypothetical protein
LASLYFLRGDSEGTPKDYSNCFDSIDELKSSFVPDSLYLISLSTFHSLAFLTDEFQSSLFIEELIE